MSSVLGLREISPPPLPSVEFRFWRDLPRWRKPFGCPDCRKCYGRRGGLRRHLRREHPRWQAFFQALNPPILSREQVREKRRAALNRYYAQPGNREKLRAALNRYYAQPGNREKLRAALNRYYAQPGNREKRRAAMNRPEVREKLRAALNRPEVREKRRAALNRYYAQPGNREKLRAAMNRPDPVAAARERALRTKPWLLRRRNR